MKTFIHKPLHEIDIPFVEQLDRKDGHYYLTKSGKIYPSITTILSIESKEGIDIWRAKIGEKEADRISSESVEVGTKLHSIIEDYLNNKGIPDKVEGNFAMDPLKLFHATEPLLDKIDNIMALETKLYSDELQLAGKVDCIADFEGIPSIVDFKNSRKSKTPSRCRGYYKQGTAYAKMLKELTGIDIQQVVIIVASWDPLASRAFKEKPENWESALWDTILKYEVSLI